MNATSIFLLSSTEAGERARVSYKNFHYEIYLYRKRKSNAIVRRVTGHTEIPFGVKCQFYTQMNDESPRKRTARRKGAYKFPIPHRYLPDDPISFRYIRNTSSTAVLAKIHLFAITTFRNYRDQIAQTGLNHSC